MCPFRMQNGTNPDNELDPSVDNDEWKIRPAAKTNQPRNVAQT